MLKELFNLFYPLLCAACDETLVRGEKVICSSCLSQLPFTDFYGMPGNPVEKQFWGRLPDVHAAALLHFVKGSRVQELIHRLKYRNMPEIGQRLGELMASAMLKQVHFSLPEVLIPVPIDPKKRKIRGYNQSEELCKGISDVLQIPTEIRALIKVHQTETQTRKNRFSRYANMLTAFQLQRPELVENKRVMLVDDVLTTGSTLEACGKEILTGGVADLSVFTLAYTD